MDLRVDHHVPTVEHLAAVIQAAMDAGTLPNPAVNAIQVLRCTRAYLRDHGGVAPLPTTVSDTARAYAAVVWRGGHSLAI
jgi:hypothetical protein